MTRDERQHLSFIRWVKSGCKGVILAATGYGKTRVATNCIKWFLDKNPGKSVRVIVPTEVLKRQWMKDLISVHLFNNVEVEIINSAIKHLTPVNLLIIDEIHLIASPEFIKILETPYNIILGLTGTINRLDGRESLILKQIPVCDRIDLTDALENDWVSGYKEYKVLIDVDLDKYNDMNSKFLGAFAFFGYDFDLAMKCVTNKRTRHYLASRMRVAQGVVDANTFQFSRCLRGRKDFVLKHPKKLELAKKIIKARPNAKIITFSATIAEAKKMPTRFILHSKNKKKENEALIAEFDMLDSGVIASNKCLDQGYDAKGLSVGIVLAGDSSSIRKRQRLGRVIRKEEGKSAEIFYLVIKGTVEETWHSKASEGLDYITISEQDLDNALNYKPVKEIQSDKFSNSLRY